MKLKLKNPDAPAGDAPAALPVEADVSAAPKPGGLKLKLKPSSTTASPATADPAAGQAGDVPKPKRKYTKKAKFDESGNPIPPSKPGPKKRAREDGDDVETPATKRKPKPTAKSLAMANDSEDDDDLLAQEPVPAPSRPQPARTQSIKLSIKPKSGGSNAAPPRTGTAILKVKGMGKAPVRPYGVGYDSEAEEAEKDPAIESQFVLRMLPGPDCDLLRKSIEEKTIGKSMAQGGPGVYFRFFDREGRRAMLTIQGRMYAASMVELPTVIESLKSWNKKDWVKTADVCQMLLVLGRVQSEEEAKKFPRPSYVEPDSHRFPHGLTPPMQWARKRRFRPRRSYLDVERAEAHMNRLLVEDENAVDSKYDLVDSDEETAGDSDSEEESEGDEDMMDTQQGGEQNIEEVDAGDLEQMLAEGFMEDEDVELQVDVNDLFGQANGGAEPATPATAHDVALHALQQSGAITLETDTAASTPAAATSADDDDDDDDDDADSDDEANGVDDAAEAEEQRKEQLRSEIAELEKAVQSHVDARNAATNKIFKTRKQKEIDKLQADLDIKRRQLGEDLDE